MTKLLGILLIGLVFEAIGVVYLSRGLKQMGEVQRITPAEVARVIQRGVTNPNVLLGVLFEAAFFGCLLVLMSKADVSFIWPLTALGFVLTTLAAKFVLREQVSWMRWSGVLLIMIGAALVTWSEQAKPKAPLPPPNGSTSAPPR